MDRSDYVKLFNDANEGRPNQNLMTVISEYIYEKNPKYAGQMMSFLNSNLHLVNVIFPQIMSLIKTDSAKEFISSTSTIISKLAKVLSNKTFILANEV